MVEEREGRKENRREVGREGGKEGGREGPNQKNKTLHLKLTGDSKMGTRGRKQKACFLK
jgi:hypothetical protein